MNTKGGRPGAVDGRFIPLSYIDDVNSVRVGKAKPMDDVLEEVSTRYRLK